MEALNQIDRVKFYPKTNQPDARMYINRERMGRNYHEQGYETNQTIPVKVPNPSTIADFMAQRNIELEVSPASDERSSRGLNTSQRIGSRSSFRSPGILKEVN